MNSDIQRRGKDLAKKVYSKGRRLFVDLKKSRLPKPKIPASAYEVDVSVVIPVYNCEEYIEQAIRSISDHTICRYEIIAINDQSPDNALAVLRKLATDIPQLIVLDQDNIGGAKTLNRGLSLTKGKYVTCLDCDDWLAPGALDVLFTTAESSGAEVVGGIIQKYTNGLYDDIHDFSYIKKHMEIDVASGIPASVLIDSFYTGKLFLRSHLETYGITFNPALLYADRPFVTKAMVAAHKLIFVPKILGFWRKHLDGRSVTDGFQNPRNLIDKMSGFGGLLRDPIVMANKALHTTLFLEAVKRLFWNYPDADNPQFAKAFAYAARALIAGYPSYNTLDGKKLSLRRKLIFDQISAYDDEHLFGYRIALERAIAASAGLPVGDVARQMKAVPHVGQRNVNLPPYPVVKNPNMVVFESFFGKSYGGNPRYLYEELVKSGRKFTAVWVYSPKRKPFKMTAPDHVTLVQVSRGSAQYFQLLREARYWVNNIRFPEMDKPADTIYIQTWHGTPLKRLGLDIEVTGPEAEGRASFLKDASEWDYLLAQNDYSAEIFRRAFDVKCPILVEGYPGNDILSDAGKRNRAASYLRRKYGIPAGKKIITYAPTWRDKDQVGDSWVFANKIQLDFMALREQLGNDYVVILRLHHLMARAVSFCGLEGFLYDGSKEPDANRLMAATDILITDYSSIFFDYACTGKPILFYMHDLDEYEHELRGFYLDPRTDLPGPILRDQETLIDAIHHIDQHTKAYAAKYHSFHQKFLAWDKGKSARTVVERVFSPEHNATDTKALVDLRKQTQQAADLDQLIARADWSTGAFDYDVSLVVQAAEQSDSSRLMAHDGARVQIIWLQDKAGKAPTGNNVTVVRAGKKATPHALTKAALDAAKGKFIMFLEPEAQFRPDMLSLLVQRAEASSTSLILAGAISENKRTALDDVDLVAAGYARAPSLSGKLILTDYLRRHLPVDDMGHMSNQVTALLLLAHAHRAIISPAFPKGGPALQPLNPLSATDAVNTLHLLGATSVAVAKLVFDNGLDALQQMADDTAKKMLTLALFSAVSVDFAPRVAPVQLEDIRDHDDERHCDSHLTMREGTDRSVGFNLGPVQGTYFICGGSHGLGSRARTVLEHIARTQRDARIVVAGTWDTKLVCAPGVNIRTVSYRTTDYWYWATRAAWIFADGLLPKDLMETLQEDKYSRHVVQLGTCRVMENTGWAKGALIDDQVVGATFADIPDIDLWTHVCVDPAAPIDIDALKGKTVLAPYFHQSVDLCDPLRNEAFRNQHQVQLNKTLVGVLRLLDSDGNSEDTIDLDYLRTLLPPRTEIFLSNETDDLLGFFAACDVLISPPHPAIGDYLATGKPLIAQNSYLLTSTKKWLQRADQYQTHAAIAQVIQEQPVLRDIKPPVDNPAKPFDDTAPTFEDILDALFPTVGPTS